MIYLYVCRMYGKSGAIPNGKKGNWRYIWTCTTGMVIYRTKVKVVISVWPPEVMMIVNKDTYLYHASTFVWSKPEWATLPSQWYEHSMHKNMCENTVQWYMCLHIHKKIHLKTRQLQMLSYKCSHHIKDYQSNLLTLHIRLLCMFITQRITWVVYWYSI